MRALLLHERALVIRERSLGPEHRDVASTLADLATTLNLLGRTARAQSLAARAIAIWDRTDTPEAPEFAKVLKVYADLQSERGEALMLRNGTTTVLAQFRRKTLAGIIRHLPRRRFDSPRCRAPSGIATRRSTQQ